MSLCSIADQSQIYCHCLSNDVDDVVCQLEGCIMEVGQWISISQEITSEICL